MSSPRKRGSLLPSSAARLMVFIAPPGFRHDTIHTNPALRKCLSRLTLSVHSGGFLPPEIGAGADREDAPPAMEALAVSDDPPPSLPRALALKAPPSKLQHGNCGRRHGVV
jgi:hypothetical protein